MVLLRAHFLASAGSAAALTGVLMGCPLLVVAAAVLAAMATDRIIDLFGHSRIGLVPVRSPRTHSVTTAPLWALLAAAAVVLLSTGASQLTPLLAQLQPANTLLPVALACEAAAAVHLFLDSLTGAGIYVPAATSPEPGPSHGGSAHASHYRRWRLAQYKYNAAPPTMLALLIGAAGGYAYYQTLKNQTFSIGLPGTSTDPWTLITGQIANPWTIPGTATPAATTAPAQLQQGLPTIGQVLAQSASALYALLSTEAVKWPLAIMIAILVAVELVPRLLLRSADSDETGARNHDKETEEDLDDNAEDEAEGEQEEDKGGDGDDGGAGSGKRRRGLDSLPPGMSMSPRQRSGSTIRNAPRLPTLNVKLRMLCDRCGAPQTTPPTKYCDKCGALSDTTENPAAPATTTAADSPSSSSVAAMAAMAGGRLFCAMCGAEHAGREEYCDKCGERLDKPSPQSSAPSGSRIKGPDDGGFAGGEKS